MIARWLLAIVVCSVLSATGGFFFGSDYGATNVEAETSSAAVDKLNAILASHQELVQEADAASLRISQMLAKKYRFDETTTQELRDALSENADLRADLRYSARVMRILQDSRERAIQAAAGGFSGAVPGEPAGAEQ
jgi:LAS superfamily LD-carboxypeptidase LdcB